MREAGTREGNGKGAVFDKGKFLEGRFTYGMGRNRFNHLQDLPKMKKQDYKGC